MKSIYRLIFVFAVAAISFAAGIAAAWLVNNPGAYYPHYMIGRIRAGQTVPGTPLSQAGEPKPREYHYRTNSAGIVRYTAIYRANGSTVLLEATNGVIHELTVWSGRSSQPEIDLTDPSQASAGAESTSGRLLDVNGGHRAE